MYLKKPLIRPKLSSFRDSFLTSEATASTSRLKIKQLNLFDNKKDIISLNENDTIAQLALSTNSNQNSSRDINDNNNNNNSISLCELNTSNTSASQMFQVLKSMKQPDMSKAMFKPKTPLHFSPDKRIRDAKTPVGPRNGRWSPIKLKTIRSPRLYDV